MITKKDLAELGFAGTGDGLCSIQMVFNDEEESHLSLRVVNYRNQPELAIIIPGGTIYLPEISTVEDLKVVVKALRNCSYESNF